jgi:diphthamide synthase (EF-2-diphthine--ammonia ligase)
MSVTEPLSASIRGLTYPLTIVDGNLGTSVDYSLIAQQVRSVVETRYYERVMRANYGVADNILDIMNPGQINSEFQASISANVANLSSLSVTGDWKSGGEDGIYHMYIQYSVNGVPQPPLQFSLAN